MVAMIGCQILHNLKSRLRVSEISEAMDESRKFDSVRLRGQSERKITDTCMYVCVENEDGNFN